MQRYDGNTMGYVANKSGNTGLADILEGLGPTSQSKTGQNKLVRILPSADTPPPFLLRVLRFTIVAGLILR